MEYILLIHDNTTTTPAEAEWMAFIERAQASGTFRGGSEVGVRESFGQTKGVASTAHIAGYMRFEADDRQVIVDLLARHPVVVHGGTVELCELPKS